VGYQDLPGSPRLLARADPDHVAAERRALEQWLGYHRDTLLTKCAGLTAGQLERCAVPPSNLSLWA